MFLLEWYKEWLDIRADYRSRKTELTREVKAVEICQSCETLREQLSLERETNRRLLDRIMEKPEKVVDEPPKVSGGPILPSRHMSFRVRQQALEAEDRRRAQLLKNAPQPATTDVAELEKELDIASTERAAEATNKVS